MAVMHGSGPAHESLLVEENKGQDKLRCKAVLRLLPTSMDNWKNSKSSWRILEKSSQLGGVLAFSGKPA